MSPSQKTKDTHTIGLISTCHGLSHFYQLVVPALLLTISDSLALNFSQISLALICFYSTSGIGQPISGILVDKFGAKLVLSLGTAVYGIGIGAVGLSENITMLVFAMSIAGLGNSIYHPADLTILNSCVSKVRLPYAYSMHLIGGQIGWALAPVIMVTLANIFDWRTAYYIVAFPAFAIALAIPFQKIQAIELDQTTSHQQQHNMSFLQVAALPGVLLMLLFFTFNSVSLVPIQQFGQVIFHELFRLSEEHAALYISAFLLSGGLGSFFGAYLLKNNKRITGHLPEMIIRLDSANQIAFVGMTLSALSCLLMIILPSVLLLPLLIINGLSFGIVSPSRDSLVSTISRGKNLGKAYGIVYAGLDIGALIGPALAGYLADSGAIAAILLISVFGSVIVALLSLHASKHTPSP